MDMADICPRSDSALFLPTASHTGGGSTVLPRLPWMSPLNWTKVKQNPEQDQHPRT